MNAAIVIPTLDESAHIEGLLAHLLAEPEAVAGEILVVDGGSRDGTREAVARIASEEPRVRLIDNPGRIQASGVNRAVAAADPRFDAIVRVDAHALYPQDYVRRLLASLEESGADTVVVRLTATGRSCFQRAVGAAQNSWIGTGGSAHRMGTESGFVDHGHHAAFRRHVFEETGGYDSGFEANEDAELDARIRARGGQIWLDAAIPVLYFPRSTLRGLSRQYFKYGSGRAQTALKHGERLKLRQMLPPLVVFALALGLLGAPLAPRLLLIPLGYAAVLVIASLVLCFKARSACMLLAAPALATMHIAWGLGFLRRMALRWRRRTKPILQCGIGGVSDAERGREAG